MPWIVDSRIFHSYCRSERCDRLKPFLEGNLLKNKAITGILSILNKSIDKFLEVHS